MSGDDRYIEERASDEEFLNSAIDAVAREMTEGEPSGTMRARVLERIAQGGRRSSPGLPRWALAGAAAAAVLVLAAAVWIAQPAPAPREALATAAEQRPAAPDAERAAVQPAATSASAASPEGVSAAAARASRAVAARGVRAAGNEAPEDFNPVPALAAIEPLRLAAVEPAPLHVADMEITQISEMPSIEIRSLDQGSHDIQSADPKKEK